MRLNILLSFCLGLCVANTAATYVAGARPVVPLIGVVIWSALLLLRQWPWRRLMWKLRMVVGGMRMSGDRIFQILLLLLVGLVALDYLEHLSPVVGLTCIIIVAGILFGRQLRP